MQKNVKIELVTHKDANDLLAIYAPYVKETAITFEYEVPSVEEFKERIINISSKYPYIKLLDENGMILGYAYASSFKGRTAYDWAVECSIYIKKEAKGQGFGRLLYEKLEKLLKEMGILNMYACIAIPDKEDEYLTFDSVKFHEKLAFKRVGYFEKCGYKFNRWYNMIWMEKILGTHHENVKKVEFGHFTL
ncbi:phosphinothricin acetyltransferase [Acetitomaculum ruminis DSM 5522]|uniref:Phosphinothricin acetyltransferase n=1 Tax=Acetitomaculum ruminis DSM 5522 TaxID=1120918 RepID=A0A1I0XCL7_9FIRM|nr:GNAT family N-acetyltransferase [Acetitomaculum ruminis]SFA97703.1 phosphinothricin acetyltransferase [Acetitomaculum ruminis DSM 5522]